MKKLYQPLLCGTAIIILLAFGSCHKVKNGNLTIHFNAVYGSQYFDLDTFNTDPDGRIVQVSMLEFLVSHITLVKTNNSTIEISPVNHLVLWDTTASYNVTVNNIEGNFKGINFNCGIDSTQNNSITPADVPVSDPLGYYPYGTSGSETMFWQMIKYRFEVLQGSAGTVKSDTMPVGLAYHVGGNSYYQLTQLSGNFSVCCESNTTVNITLDVEKIFNQPGDTINVFTQSHAGSTLTDNPAVAAQFAVNFSQSFSISQ